MGYLHVYITAHIYTVVACKFFSKMQPLVCKHLQKNNEGMTVHYIYILLPVYQLHFQKFCLIQNQWKRLKTYLYLVKTTLKVCLIFHIEASIIFLGPTIKLNTKMFDFHK